MRPFIASLLCLVVLLPLSLGQDDVKKDPAETRAALAKSLSDADALFTATIGKVMPISETNSIPPSIRGKVFFKEVKLVRGAAEGAAFFYSYKEGHTPNLMLDTEGKVLVALKEKNVVVIVPATAENLKLIEKAK